MPVTNENKILYLNLLAQYRLANQVREEVEHFLKGNAQSVFFDLFCFPFLCFFFLLCYFLQSLVLFV